MKYLVLSITKPFEHILLIVVGDLLRLQPVGGRPVYANYRNYSKIFDLFGGYFKIFELTELIRHKRVSNIKHKRESSPDMFKYKKTEPFSFKFMSPILNIGLIRHKRDDTSVDLLSNVRIARPQSNYLKLL